MAVIGDAGAVDRLAATFDNAADQMARLGADAERRVQHAIWESHQADRMRGLAGSRADRCRQEAGELQDLARALRRHADWIRATETELRSLERRIRAWAAAHPAGSGVTTHQPDASLIRYFPAPLSFEWRDLAARLRANGVAF